MIGGFELQCLEKEAIALKFMPIKLEFKRFKMILKKGLEKILNAAPLSAVSTPVVSIESIDDVSFKIENGQYNVGSTVTVTALIDGKTNHLTLDLNILDQNKFQTAMNNIKLPNDMKPWGNVLKKNCKIRLEETIIGTETSKQKKGFKCELTSCRIKFKKLTENKYEGTVIQPFRLRCFNNNEIVTFDCTDGNITNCEIKRLEQCMVVSLTDAINPKVDVYPDFLKIVSMSYNTKKPIYFETTIDQPMFKLNTEVILNDGTTGKIINYLGTGKCKVQLDNGNIITTNNNDINLRKPMQNLKVKFTYNNVPWAFPIILYAFKYNTK